MVDYFQARCGEGVTQQHIKVDLEEIGLDPADFPSSVGRPHGGRFRVIIPDLLYPGIAMIECDGVGHYKPNSGWTGGDAEQAQDTFVRQRETDIIRRAYCAHHRLALVRVSNVRSADKPDLLCTEAEFYRRLRLALSDLRAQLKAIRLATQRARLQRARAIVQNLRNSLAQERQRAVALPSQSESPDDS